MAELGESDQHQLAPGASDLLALQSAKKQDGSPAYDTQSVLNYKQEQTNALRTMKKADGTPAFNEKQIADYWGDYDAKSSPDLSALMARNAAKAPPTLNPAEAFMAGLGNSSSGLIASGGKGGAEMSGAEDHFSKLAEFAGGVVGDIPASIAGALGGGAAGAGAGVETGPGAVLTGAAGAGAGAAALPVAIREAYGVARKSGEVKSFADMVPLIADAAKNIGIATIAGAVSGGVGGKVAGVLEANGAGALTKTAATGASELASYAGVSATLSGQVPDETTFTGGVVMILGAMGGKYVHGAFQMSKSGLTVKSNLERIYKDTGLAPEQAIEKAKTDPRIREELFQQGPEGEPITPNLRAAAPDEPQPAKPEKPVPSLLQAADEATAALKGPTPPTPNLPAHGSVDAVLPLVRGLEGSGDAAVSPKGAVGRYQIMPGTARQYGFKPEEMTDPATNEAAARAVLTDLNRRYNGDVAAVLTGYNAGPGWANKLVAAGPGTRLEAVEVNGHVTYTSVKASRDESFLPMETQKYLANGRRRTGTDLPGDAGGNGKPPEPPEPPAAGEEPEPKSFADRPTADAEAEVLSIIGVEPKQGWNLKQKWDDFQGGVVSSLHYSDEVDKVLNENGQNPMTEMTLSNRLENAMAYRNHVDYFLKHGTLDGEGNHLTDESWTQAVQEVKDAGGTPDGWTAYMLAKQAGHMEARGQVSGIDTEAAAKVHLDPEYQAKYEKATRTLNNVMNAALQYAVDKGRLSQESVDAMITANPDYVTLSRMMGDEGIPTNISQKKPGFGSKGSIKKREGSDRLIHDPIKGMIDNMTNVIRMADQNEPALFIADLAKRGKIEAESVGPLEKGQVEPYLAARAKVGEPSAGNFVVYRDGKAEAWRAKDPALTQLITTAETNAKRNWLADVAYKFADLQRAGITIMPDFLIRNALLRDQLETVILDPHHPPPWVNLHTALWDSFGQGKAFKEFLANGGLADTISGLGSEATKLDLYANVKETGFWEKAWNVVKSPFEAMQLIHMRVNTAQRMGYVKFLRDKGIPLKKAVISSSRAYLNFDERGAYAGIQAWARATPFLRPSLLALARVGRAAYERPVTTALYSAGYITAPTAFLYMVNYLQDQGVLGDLMTGQKLKDTQKWSEVERFYKDTSLNLPVIGGQRLHLPLPQGLNVVFGGMTNRFMDYLIEKDPKAFDGLASTLWEQFVPGVIPAIALPVTEQLTNYKFFSSQKLIPASLEDAHPQMQFSAATTETGKALTRALQTVTGGVVDMSPITFENYVNGYAGSAPLAVARVLETSLGADTKPQDLSTNVFVRSFFVRHDAYSLKSVQEFYDEASKSEAYRADIRLANKRGDTDAAEDAAQDPNYAGVFSASRRALSAIASNINRTEQSKDLTTDEKRQAIETQVEQMLTISQNGLKYIRDTKASRH